MKYAVRLKENDLLKESIKKHLAENNIVSGVIISSVGSLKSVVLRNAGATSIIEVKEKLEIISLNGTLSTKRSHLHISLSKNDLSVIGGHLIEGVVDTTCELVIEEVEEYEFDTAYDDNTKYNEIIIKKR